MNVRTKLGLLLFAVVATFIAGLVAVKVRERQKFHEVSLVREEERRRSFDDFVRHWSESFEFFVHDFSASDQMVAAVEGGESAQAEANLTENALARYHAHAVWVYRLDGTAAFTRNVLYSDALLEVPLPVGAMPTLLDGPHRCHFFAHTPLGLMEISGATIHPSNDGARTSRVRGYFFAGRLWSNADLAEMSMVTGNAITITGPDSGASPPSDRPDLRVVSFTRPLVGWDGKPLAALAVRNESPVVEQLIRSSDRLFVGLIVFALVLFLVLVLSLTRWVSSPLRTLSRCLKTQNLECLRQFQPRRDEFGDFARMMGAFFEQRQSLVREIAERRQTEAALHESEERLRHSQKMDAVGRLAGGIAHDFNNLLTAIIGYAELIALRSRDPATQEEAAQISKAGEQAADLTRQLLAFSRKQILQPRVIDLNELVREMQKLLRRVIGEQIALRFEPGANGARVCADPTQLEQVLLNLGVNARDAMPRGGVLEMRTGESTVEGTSGEENGALPPGRYVTLTVRDSGCGMDAETRLRVFEPFFTTKGPGKGTGLGLATVYGIVRQSGGAITVTSQPGEGTSFTISLPRADAPLDPLRPPPGRLERRGQAETVLVVEDEEIVRELVCVVLSDQGYEVLCAAEGGAGLKMAREHPLPIDLLVSDVIMPRMNGPEVARELRLLHPHVRVLFVSGYSDADIAEGGVLAREVHLLQKPFTPEALSRRVREVLDDTSDCHVPA